MTELQCLDLTVKITARPTRLGDELAALYRGCERRDGDTPATSEIELQVDECDAIFSLSVGGAACDTFDCVRDLFLRASLEIDRQCVAASTGSHLLLHASCVARGSRAALVVGPSSAGKSTLAAALTLAGLDYVGDEVIGLRAGTPYAFGYPKPFKLDGRARHALANAFGRADLCIDSHDREDLVAPGALGSARAAGTCTTPALVVRPAFANGAPIGIEKLTRADVAESLADQCFNFASWGGEGLRIVANVARRCEGVRLRFGDIATAVATIDKMLS